MLQPFKISATGLSMNYMPEYLADKLGYYEEVGLKLDTYVPAPWTKVLTDIDSGEYHCVVGGIWVPSIYNRRIRDYRAFAKVASRCPLVLVTREPVKEFTWKWLEGKTVLASGGNAASPALFLNGIAKEGGADISKMFIVHDFYASMLYECFIGGMGDAVLLKSDLAAQIQAAGKGYIAADLTKWGGPVPWSVYYCRPELLEREDNLCGRFTQALQKATTWLLNHSGYDCKEILQQNWPKVELNNAMEIIDMFIKEGMWDATVDIKPDELERWEKMLYDGRVIDHVLSFDEVCDNRAFEYAKRQLGME